MTITLESESPLAAPAPAIRTTAPTSKVSPSDAARYDLYAGIHKGLRALMCDTLVSLGRVDPHDQHDVAAALGQVHSLLNLCRVHVHDENTYLHPALERCETGASTRIAGEHEDHQREIEALAARVDAIAAAEDGRAGALARLYRQLSLFVADNFEHMAYEETWHNELLWSTFSDAELLDIEHAIVASIEPALMGQFLRWMLPSMNHPERSALLADMRLGAPAEAFAGVVQMTRGLVSRSEWRKLNETLALRAC